MLFSSINFLYYFLSVVLALYFLVPKKLKNAVLLLSSLFFYFYGEPYYTIIMIVSSLSGYLHGLWIAGTKGRRDRRLPLISSVAVNLGMLIFFKYTNFFIKNINQAFSSDISFINVVLPIGISFYTFQILSYTIDVYRGEAKVQKNFLDFTAYVTLFPQLIAGPIVRYTTVESELAERKHSFADFAYGVNRFIIGLSKKVIIANTLGELGKIFQNSGEKSVLFYWIAAAAFMLHIYFDFSGYSDMAIGLGRLLGFHFMENFNYPYISKSITEFWRRWHISLGTWFRDYLYIPMGGNRVGWLKWIRNIIVVWLLTGFWHGAQWNFIVWGLYFAIFLILEKLLIIRLLKKMPSIVGHLYMLFFITISFVIFNGDGLGDVVNNLAGMFGLLKVPFTSPETLYYLRSYGLIMVIAAVGATPFVKVVVSRLRMKYEKFLNLLEPVLHAVLILIITGYLIDGSFNPFLYFRF